MGTVRSAVAACSFMTRRMCVRSISRDEAGLAREQEREKKRWGRGGEGEIEGEEDTRDG